MRLTGNEKNNDVYCLAVLMQYLFVSDGQKDERNSYTNIELCKYSIASYTMRDNNEQVIGFIGFLPGSSITLCNFCILANKRDRKTI